MNLSKKVIVFALIFSNALTNGFCEEKVKKENNNEFLWKAPTTVNMPSVEQTYQIAVIGAGAAGSFAAYRGVLNNNSVLLFTGGKNAVRKGRGSWVPQIHNDFTLENEKRPIMQYRNKMIASVNKGPLAKNLSVVDDNVVSIKKINDTLFHITDSTGKTYKVNYVVMASGMMDIQPVINGEIYPILPFANTSQAIYCVRCDGHLTMNKEVVVIGHTNSAANYAILLHERYPHKGITILTNGQNPEWDTDSIEKLEKYNISVVNEKIKDVHHTNEKEKSDWRLLGFKLENDCLVKAEIAVIALGVLVNNQLLKQLNVNLDNKGFAITDQYCQTSTTGVYAIGDLQADSMKQVYVAKYTAVKAMDKINSLIRSDK